MVKIAVLGLVTIFLTMIAGSVKREYGIAVMIGAALLLGVYSISSIEMVVTRIREFESAIGLEKEYLDILLRMLGIAYLTQFVVSLCRDAGNGAVAGQISIVGKISMMLVSFPVLEALLKTLGDMLK
ncbi:MAG: stage III sporulation protein AD [Eubacterium sp.]|nr:stage III sporulation protein AD [Eubacterium sp.]